MSQIGSVTECIEAVKLTKMVGWRCIMATYGCDSGETEDTTWAADLSVGLAMYRSNPTIGGSRFLSLRKSSD
ncbi:hypothetical protein TIFTF001_035012 [Ficus carica]|uniref:phosphopyruvate hydratase n=1 Tax=Ficus carica TaxID=3494 RepID=A0AA88JB92_FICCA|nr:hypothetical protein TIFTF001_035012 [Ficus carica]